MLCAFEQLSSIIYCQHDFEGTRGSARQGWGTCGAGLSPHLAGSFGAHSPHGRPLLYPHIPSLLVVGERWRFGAPLLDVQRLKYTRYRNSTVCSVSLKCPLQSKVCLCGHLDPLHPACKEHLRCLAGASGFS